MSRGFYKLKITKIQDSPIEFSTTLFIQHFKKKTRTKCCTKEEIQTSLNALKLPKTIKK